MPRPHCGATGAVSLLPRRSSTPGYNTGPARNVRRDAGRRPTRPLHRKRRTAGPRVGTPAGKPGKRGEHRHLAETRRGISPAPWPPRDRCPPPQAVKVDGHYAWQHEPRPGAAGVHRSCSNNPHHHALATRTAPPTRPAPMPARPPKGLPAADEPEGTGMSALRTPPARCARCRARSPPLGTYPPRYLLP